MSHVANPTRINPVVVSQQSVHSGKNIDMETVCELRKKNQDIDSETESETTSEDEDTSDDDKRMADNPVLKERLKQLDRYANPVVHSSQSPVANSDQLNVANLYGLSADVVQPHHLPVNTKSRCISDVMEGSSTPSDYRSQQPSVSGSSNTCSHPASLNLSVTPKHTFSPPYGITGAMFTGSSQHDPTGISNSYSHLTSYPGRPEAPLDYACPGPVYRSDSEGSREKEVLCPMEGQSFSCETCHSVYANRSSLRSHMKKHMNQVVKRHQCDQCSYSTQYGKNLSKHVESMHFSDPDNHYKCGGCGNRFSTEGLLRDHECFVNQCNAYSCNECGRVFKTKLRLKYHGDIHNPRKPYVCDMEGCDRAFRTPKYLKNHRDEFHRMQPKNYTCPVEGCDAIFHRKTHLKRHVSTHNARALLPNRSTQHVQDHDVNDAEKKYPCHWPNCQRRFCSEETLSVHYRKHTGEKPFSCALCSFTCYNKPTLNEHYRIHHAKDATEEGPYKNCNNQMSSPAFPQQVVATSHSMREHVNSTPARASTPLVRHRMADILDSRSSQPPGPLDAEINGILDSLDKESDLPDLFCSENFDLEHPGAAPRLQGQSSRPSEHMGSPYTEANSGPTSSLASGRVHHFAPAAVGSHETSTALSNILSTVLCDFQRAELSASEVEFEKAKENALSLLPRFVTGDALGEQIAAVTDEVLDAWAIRSLPLLKATFQSYPSLSREESYMIECMEQQLLGDAPLVAPMPPRRRGRRPKLQQQLKPYLERVYTLESSTAEAMAAQLISTAQQEYELEQNVYASLPPSSHHQPRGRGRGGIGRGRGGLAAAAAGRSLSLTLKVLSDGSVSRAAGGQANPIGRSVRGGPRNRLRVGQLARFGRVMPSVDQYAYERDCFDVSNGGGGGGGVGQLEDAKTSAQLRQLTNASDTGSDEDLDELDEPLGDDDVMMEDGNIEKQTQPCDTVMGHQYNTTSREAQVKLYSSHITNDLEMNKQSHCYLRDGDAVINQDSLGEMLEDLGVIVKRIGERTAARKYSHFQDNSATHISHLSSQNEVPRGMNDEGGLSRLPHSVTSAHSGSRCNNTSKTGSHHGPTIQLPSMAVLASGSVGTPTSSGSSTPGCQSNPDVQAVSPHLSAGVSHLRSSVASAQPYVAGSISTPLSVDPGAEKLEPVLSQGNSYASTADDGYPQQRALPMWSCESMCRPSTTRANSGCTGVGDADTATSSNMVVVDTATTDYDDLIAEESGVRHIENVGNPNQAYCPTDLSTTRVINYAPHSSASSSGPSHQSSPLPSSSAASPMDAAYHKPAAYSSLHMSSPSCNPVSQSSANSLMSAVEAVDHLRSLSALGAKYTDVIGGDLGNGEGGEDEATMRHHHHHQQANCFQSARFADYAEYSRHSQQQQQQPTHRHSGSPGRSPTPRLDDSLNSSQAHHHHPADMFMSPCLPSALDSLLCRDRKCGSRSSLVDSPLLRDRCSPPAPAPPPPDKVVNCPSSTLNSEVPGTGAPMETPQALGYSPTAYLQSSSSRCSSRSRSETAYAASGSCVPQSTSSTPNSVVYLQQQQQQQQQHQQQQHQQSHHYAVQMHHPHVPLLPPPTPPTARALGVSSSSSSSQQQQQQAAAAGQHNTPLSQHLGGVGLKSAVPVQEQLTTRQLLSEAAATAAYAQGLGRCDSHSYSGGGGGGEPPHAHHNGSPSRVAQYQMHHPSSAGSSVFLPHTYQQQQATHHRYPADMPDGYAMHHQQQQQQVFHSSNSDHLGGADSSSTAAAAYMAQQEAAAAYHQHQHQQQQHHHQGQQPGPHHFYPNQLRSRSLEQQQQQQLHQTPPPSATAAAHLAHSIHEVSGLAAAEAAAAAAYAYHHYHQQQQQQASRHASLSAAQHYQGLLSQQHHQHHHNQQPAANNSHLFHHQQQHHQLQEQHRPSSYYAQPGGSHQVMMQEEAFLPRDLALYTAAAAAHHCDRRDPKSAYLMAEAYHRNAAASSSTSASSSQAGRFLF